MQDAQTLRRNFLWNTFGQLTYMLCQFLCGILVVRLAGEQVSGVYNTALTATGIFLSIASYGMYSFQVSDIRGKYGASTYIRSRVWTCALAVALCIGFVAVERPDGRKPIQRPAERLRIAVPGLPHGGIPYRYLQRHRPAQRAAGHRGQDLCGARRGDAGILTADAVAHPGYRFDPLR